MPQETIPISEVPADSATATDLGVVLSHQFAGSVEVVQLAIEQTGDSDAAFNLELNGNDVFSSEQSVSASDTVETFEPDQNTYAAGGARLTLDVSSAAGGAGELLNGGVLVRHGE